MGRGGQGSMNGSGPVPVLRRPVGTSTSMSKLRAPGAGYDHKKLTMADIYSKPVRVGGTGGVAKPQPRNPLKSHGGGLIGNRGKTGRANVGASNRRTTKMGGGEVLSATGKAVLNSAAVVQQEGSFHKAQRDSHLPGRPTTDPNTTKALQIATAQVVQRELQGPPGVGKLGASESNLGDVPVNFAIDNPEPTSGRGRQSKNEETAGGAQAVRDGKPLVKYKPELVSKTEKVLGQRVVEARVQDNDLNAENPAAKPPKVPVKAKPYLAKADELGIKPRTYGRKKPEKFALTHVPMIPGLRGTAIAAVPGLRYMPVTILTDQLEKAEKIEGMGMSGAEILKNVAEWAEARGANISKTFRRFDEDKSGTVDVNEFKEGLAMIGFEPSEKELKEVLKIVDKVGFCCIATTFGTRILAFTGSHTHARSRLVCSCTQDDSGEVDYEEFASRISKILGDEDFKQSPLSASDRSSPSQQRPSTAGSAESRMVYTEIYNPYSERARPQTAPSLPQGMTRGSWGSRSEEVVATVGGTKKKATEWKNTYKTVPVPKDFDVEEVDCSWSFAALRTPEEQQELAQIRSVPEFGVKEGGELGVDCLGGALKDKLTQMAPQIADAFVVKDKDRTGKFTRGEFRDVMYKMNVNLTETQVERVFATYDRTNEDKIGWEDFLGHIDQTKKGPSTLGENYGSMLDQMHAEEPPQSLAVKLLPKTPVAHVGIPGQKRDVSFGLGDPHAPMPFYSAKNSQQVAPVFKATGQNSAYHITQDGIKPGSTLDHYERETRWVDRHQKAEKEQKKQRSMARQERKAANQERCKKTYKDEADKAEAKRQKRIQAFRKQKTRYVRRMRFLDPWNNAQVIEHHGQDTTSAMHASVPDHYAFEEPKTVEHDPYGMGANYGAELGKPSKNKRPTIAERHAAEYKQKEGGRAIGM